MPTVTITAFVNPGVSATGCTFNLDSNTVMTGAAAGDLIGATPPITVNVVGGLNMVIIPTNITSASVVMHCTATKSVQTIKFYDGTNPAGAFTPQIQYHNFSQSGTFGPLSYSTWSDLAAAQFGYQCFSAVVPQAGDGMNITAYYAVVTYTVPPLTYWSITIPGNTIDGVLTPSFYAVSDTQPDDFILPIDLFIAGVFYPAGTVFIWVIADIPPTDVGWWLSINQTFAGAAFIVSNSRPKNPRGFTEISGFAN